MKLNTFVAGAFVGLLSTSLVYAAPVITKVDDTNSTTMQQMPSDTNSASPDAMSPGPMAENNVGAIPPSTTMPSENTNAGQGMNNNTATNNSMDSQASNNMDPQSVGAATGDADMSADTATGDDDY